MAKFRMGYDEYFPKHRGGGDDDLMSFYDEIDIVDFKYYPESRQFTYPCPCGDLFIVSLEDLQNGETVARCPSCSLVVFVSYGAEDIARYDSQ